jgi:TPR repeat protein
MAMRTVHGVGTAVTLAALLVSASLQAQEWRPPEVATAEAEQLIASGDVAAAVPLLERAGRNWYPDADLRLGLVLLSGEGIERDVDRAIHHLRRAARPNWMRVLHKRGHPEAQHALAEIYRSKDVGPLDPEAAYRLHRSAARAGHEGSQLALARHYADGEGVRSAPENALHWAIVATTAGDPAVRDEAKALATRLRETLPQHVERRIEREAARFEPTSR